MPQVFPPTSDTFARLTLVALGIGVAGICLGGGLISWSPYLTRVGVAREQPVPFSHEHHVRDLGLDCRFCHTSVENSSFAGLPPTKTCMTCHSQIWTDSPMLEPVRASFRNDTPIRWTRVHQLADFVYFDHSIHVRQGVGCVTCHGRVDAMPLLRKSASMQMHWCLECHRQPQNFVRPREHVFAADWQPPPDHLAMGRQLVADYGIHTTQLANCSICHR